MAFCGMKGLPRPLPGDHAHHDVKQRDVMRYERVILPLIKHIFLVDYDVNVLCFDLFVCLPFLLLYNIFSYKVQTLSTLKTNLIFTLVMKVNLMNFSIKVYILSKIK